MDWPDQWEENGLEGHRSCREARPTRRKQMRLDGAVVERKGGEAERPPGGFTRVLTAPFSSDIPELWDSS